MFPVLFNSKLFTLYSYPFFMGLGWGVALLFTSFLLSKNNYPEKEIKKLFCFEFIIAWIGAKLFFLNFSSDFNQVSRPQFWLGGGFVFYGGLVFGTIFFIFYSLIFKKFKFELTYNLLPGIALGHAVGRVGCFLAGCCYGNETSLPWSVQIDGVHRHPSQIYEIILLLLIFFFIQYEIKKNIKNEYIILSYFFIYSLGRFLLEFFRGDVIRGFIFNQFSTSQIIALIIIGISLFLAFLIIFHQCKVLKKGFHLTKQ